MVKRMGPKLAAKQRFPIPAKMYGPQSVSKYYQWLHLWRRRWVFRTSIPLATFEGGASPPLRVIFGLDAQLKF